MEPSPAETSDDDTDTDTADHLHRGPRRICPGCSRPIPVCLCPFLPPHPIPTKTQVIILQHPHEARHRLSTTPLLTRCLANATAVTARRLRPGLVPVLDRLSPPAAACYLFPPSPGRPSAALSTLPHPPPAVVIAFDATWRHAREMVSASEGYLGKFATRVCLDYYDEGVAGGSIYDSALVLRKEPCGGCVSTAEAVARALGAVERPGGAQIEAALVGVLREMVRLQAQFLKPVKPRPKLGKKGKRVEEEEPRRVRVGGSECKVYWFWGIFLEFFGE